MNRPAVRNVRALRTERELDHARQVHAQGRERRRVAASHRGIVASVLLGVSLGAWVLGLVTALPWWPALLPTALLGVSMVAGRRAALASAAADRRERRRIAELEHTLVSLTGRRSSASVVAAPRSSVDSAGSAASVSAASPAAPAVSAGAVRDPFMERLAQEGAQQAAARSATSAPETTAEATTGAAVESPAEVEVSHAADSEAQRMAELDADLDAETAAAVAAEREATRRASVYVPSRHAGKVSRDMGVREAVSRDGGEESSPGTKDFVASLSTSTSRRLTGWGSSSPRRAPSSRRRRRPRPRPPRLPRVSSRLLRPPRRRSLNRPVRPCGRRLLPPLLPPRRRGSPRRRRRRRPRPRAGGRSMYQPRPTRWRPGLPDAPMRTRRSIPVPPRRCPPVRRRPVPTSPLPWRTTRKSSSTPSTSMPSSKGGARPVSDRHAVWCGCRPRQLWRVRRGGRTHRHRTCQDAWQRC